MALTLVVACSAPRHALELPRSAAWERGPRAAQAPEQESVWADVRTAPSAIGSDLMAVYSRPSTWWTLAGGYVGGEALDLVNAEDQTTDFFAAHSLLPDGGSRALDELGKGYALLAGAGAWYLVEHASGDQAGVEDSQLLLRSLATTGLSTVVFKTAFADQRPNGGGGAYPSGHVSMSVTAATSLWLSQGPKVGVPAAILSGLVALQRLDSRAHELDDVIGGATLGWVVAYTLGHDEPPMLLGAQVMPAFGPSGDPGISLLWSL